ncbi:family 20 glycosylhydrolase [Nocardia sp. bgisy134]|uniref:family 20 glycosylhydrolase n=1 Tax=Nocardia sp. bgisy134 TaxID=3413789 RepID=UPI003D7247DE
MVNRRGFFGFGLGVAALPVVGVARAEPGGEAWSVGRRGVLIDVGRKHFGMPWLLRFVAYMANLGLNELHFHFSENESVRIVSDRYPEINGGVQYSKAEIGEFMRFAAGRGVAVIPDFDMPGHMGAALRPHPEFQLRNRFGVPLASALDITGEAALRYAEGLVEEYAEVFADATRWGWGSTSFSALSRSSSCIRIWTTGRGSCSVPTPLSTI